MSKTNLYLDTEFTSLHQNADLISIALVSDCGKQFYAEFNDFSNEKHKLSGCREDVLNNLLYSDYFNFNLDKNFNFHNTSIKANSSTICNYLKKWLSQFEEVKIIADFVSWDWVLFCELFGGAFSIPSNVYYIPIDFSNLLYFKGLDPDLNRLEFSEGIENFKPHNSLSDAFILKKCYNKLNSL